ncbi:unnamed protein product [Rotaria sordida]|uniref:Uncharacterized protein n=1 Tax=Rotaria sordida TaxID=392033 RepID=A0A814IDQ7_9BILA|nr:unnamed protein product [Rotaria sordida]CAF1177011.1 unnamed protein product [Rotaria sordida]
MRSIVLLVLLFCIIGNINGSHFLGGTISWRPVNASATGTSVDITITQTYSWTYSLITCTTAMITSIQLIPVGFYSYLTTQQLVCISNCGASSTGYVAPSVRPYCMDISAPVGTTVGQRSDIVTLQEDDDFSAAFQQNAWRPLATAMIADWSISVRITVNRRSDNNLYNSAPVATMMSPILIPVNQTTVIYVPVVDDDGDVTRCRWSTASNGVNECGGVCPPGSLPSNTTIDPNCTILITGQTVGNWYAVTLMVEDFINSTSTTPLSSVPVQFLVQVVEQSLCSNPPTIIGIPPKESCIVAITGQTFSSQLIAINNCGSNVTIIDITIFAFLGMTRGNVIQLNITTYYANLSWTPTDSQIGYQLLCAMAFDSQNAQSSQYCFKFYVTQTSLCACPGEACITIDSITSPTSTENCLFICLSIIMIKSDPIYLC